MPDYGLVSIIMPVWNCARFIGEAIRSVQFQSYQNWELLIQDDCSEDGTDEAARWFAISDERIKYGGNYQHSGAAITRNNALLRAEGKWVAFLDGDDVWRPEKLEHQLRFMVENDYAFSYHEYLEIGEDGHHLGVSVSGIKKVGRYEMYSCCWPGCLSVMYSREKIGLVQVKDVKKNNDTAMWLQIVKGTPCYLLKENLAYYRRRTSSLTPKPLWHRIWAHYPLFRVAEGMNPVKAMFWTLVNVAGNGRKKLFYVKRSK